MKGFYYIENSVNEYHSNASAFFETLEEAKEAIKDFSDWFCERGTGCIHFQPFGTKLDDYGCTRKLPHKFICRGMGIKDGKVIFSEKEF